MSTMIERALVPVEDTWDVFDYYTTPHIFEAEVSKVTSAIPLFSNYEGTLSCPEKVISTLSLYFEISEILDRLYTHAYCLHDVDITNEKNTKTREKIKNLYSHFSAVSSFLAPELLSLDSCYLEQLLLDSRFKDFDLFLKQIIRDKKHTLSHKEEELLSHAQNALNCARDIFNQLNNADLSFEPLTINGEKKELTHSNYIIFLQDKNPEIRKAAYAHYLNAYNAHKYSLACMYAANLKKDAFYTKIRKFESTKARYLFQEQITTEVYDRLVSTVNTHLHELHEYYSKRKKILSLDSQYISDTYVPLVDEIDIHISYNDAIDIISEALSPLGSEYVQILKRGLTSERWVDKYPNKSKKSGAYSSGSYKGKPYILMNYMSHGMDSLFTLAHEAGHSMHTFLANRSQPYSKHGYTIFTAEIASTLNEILLSDYLLQKYANDKKRRAYVNTHIVDMIKSTFFRQTMFAEFESTIHSYSDEENPITAEILQSTHYDLQKKYFGEAVVINPIDGLECLRIPHFYSSFYVYKYATGIAAAFSIAKKILSGDMHTKDAYLRMLSHGGSKYPIELLEEVDVNLGEPEVYIKMIGFFSEYVAHLDNNEH